MPVVIANHCAWHKQAARRLVEALRPLEPEGDWRVEISDRGLAFETRLHGQKTRFEHSFLDPALLRRAAQKNQGLLKACNNKRRSIHRVLDLTAGWGRDSFLLAAGGQQLLMAEQNPLIAACLEFLLETTRREQPDSPCQRMTLLAGDGLQALQQAQADCLYLDPMFPEHKSGARPGKELQLLQRLTENRDMEVLFERALEYPAQRVVVKRPLHAPPLNQRQPDLQHREKTIRFDVYLTKPR